MRLHRSALVMAVVALALGALLPIGPAGAQGAPRPVGADAPDAVPDSWIVWLTPGSDARAEAARLSSQHGGRAGHVFENVLHGFQFRGNEQAAAALSRNPRVQRVEADRRVEAEGSYPTGVRRSDGDKAHKASPARTGTGVAIAILDTGIDTAHEDLAGTVLRSGGEVVGRSCVNEGFLDDGHGHGTHVAGSAGAALGNGRGVVGVVPGARLVPVKVMNKNASGSWSAVICGLDWVAANTTTHNIRVANMSLSGSGSAGSNCSSSSLRRAVCDTVAAGVVITAAAGNQASLASSRIPAAYPEVVTVSALADFDGQPGGKTACWRYSDGRRECDDTMALFSNHGPAVDVMAPGVAINSTEPGNRYASRSGTSMAAPHAAGVAALVLAGEPHLSPAQVLTRLQETGECPDGSVNGRAGACSGAGQWGDDPDGIAEPVVNAYRASAAGAGSGSGGGGSDDDDGDAGTGGDGPGTYSQTGPDASFTHSCSDLTCTFVDTSDPGDEAVTSRAWALGDGATSTAATPSHTYAAGGSYTVTLTVTDGNGLTDSTSAKITVQAPLAGTVQLTHDVNRRGNTASVILDWANGDPGTAEVWRNGALLTTTSTGSDGTGANTDNLGNVRRMAGTTLTYVVCDAGKQRCSTPVSVTL